MLTLLNRGIATTSVTVTVGHEEVLVLDTFLRLAFDRLATGEMNGLEVRVKIGRMDVRVIGSDSVKNVLLASDELVVDGWDVVRSLTMTGNTPFARSEITLFPRFQH